MCKTDVKFVFTVSKVYYNSNKINFDKLFSNFNKTIESEEKTIKLYNPSEHRVIEVIKIVDLKKGFNSNVQIKNINENEIFFIIKTNKTKNAISSFEEFNDIIEENIETSLDFLKKLEIIETKEYNSYILQYKLVNIIGYYKNKVDIENIIKKLYKLHNIKYKICLRKSIQLYFYEKDNKIAFSKKKEKNTIGSIKIFKDKFSIFINFGKCKKPLQTIDNIVKKINKVVENE